MEEEAKFLQSSYLQIHPPCCVAGKEGGVLTRKDGVSWSAIATFILFSKMSAT